LPCAKKHDHYTHNAILAARFADTPISRLDMELLLIQIQHHQLHGSGLIIPSAFLLSPFHRSGVFNDASEYCLRIILHVGKWEWAAVAVATS